jgi:hypothetical protein
VINLPFRFVDELIAPEQLVRKRSERFGKFPKTSEHFRRFPKHAEALRKVVLENNNWSLRLLLAEELPLFLSLYEEMLVCYFRVGPGELGSVAVPSVRPSAW